MNFIGAFLGFIFGSAIMRFAKPLLFAFAALFLLTTLVCLLHLNGAMRDANVRNMERLHHPAAHPFR
jgi:hypothetical protein